MKTNILNNCIDTIMFQQKIFQHSYCDVWCITRNNICYVYFFRVNFPPCVLIEWNNPCFYSYSVQEYLTVVARLLVCWNRWLGKIIWTVIQLGHPSGVTTQRSLTSWFDLVSFQSSQLPWKPQQSCADILLYSNILLLLTVTHSLPLPL